MAGRIQRGGLAVIRVPAGAAIPPALGRQEDCGVVTTTGSKGGMAHSTFSGAIRGNRVVHATSHALLPSWGKWRRAQR